MAYTSRPRRREWSGPWLFCTLCGATMDMVIEAGRNCYECPDCLAESERQLDLLDANSSQAVA